MVAARELKAQCKSRGLAQAGKKQDLAGKLKGAGAAAGALAGMPKWQSSKARKFLEELLRDADSWASKLLAQRGEDAGHAIGLSIQGKAYSSSMQ